MPAIALPWGLTGNVLKISDVLTVNSSCRQRNVACPREDHSRFLEGNKMNHIPFKL
jgi:hypothetical protein